MASKTSTTWIRGERVATGHKGKHGGPSIKQDVVKVLAPREGR